MRAERLSDYLERNWTHQSFLWPLLLALVFRTG